MSDFNIDVSQVKKLVELVENHNLEELMVEEDDLEITIKGRAPRAAAPDAVAYESPIDTHEPREEPVAEEAVEVLSEPEVEGDIVNIVAPLVGVFYRAPAPDAPSFVEIGDEVEVGSEVGLIEAMKVFSPIPSEVAGEVVAIPAQNGTLVHEGDILVRIRVSEE